MSGAGEPDHARIQSTPCTLFEPRRGGRLFNLNDKLLADAGPREALCRRRGTPSHHISRGFLEPHAPTAAPRLKPWSSARRRSGADWAGGQSDVHAADFRRGGAGFRRTGARDGARPRQPPAPVAAAAGPGAGGSQHLPAAQPCGTGRRGGPVENAFRRPVPRGDRGAAPDYLLAQAIAHARAVMASMAMPLAEVALVVGFQSQSHFSTVFKRLTGENAGGVAAERTSPRRLTAAGRPDERLTRAHARSHQLAGDRRRERPRSTAARDVVGDADPGPGPHAPEDRP